MNVSQALREILFSKRYTKNKFQMLSITFWTSVPKSNNRSPNCSNMYHSVNDITVTKIVIESITSRATKTTPADWLRIVLAVCFIPRLYIPQPGSAGNFLRTFCSILCRRRQSWGQVFLTFFVISTI